MKSSRNRPTAARRGASMVELEVAFAAFGVILAGLCPVIAAQLKHVQKLESRFAPAISPGRPGQAYYVVPRPEPWARKLAGTATITPDAPAGSGTTAGSPANAVTILSVDAEPTREDATAVVQVQALPASSP